MPKSRKPPRVTKPKSSMGKPRTKAASAPKPSSAKMKGVGKALAKGILQAPKLRTNTRSTRKLITKGDPVLGAVKKVEAGKKFVAKVAAGNKRRAAAAKRRTTPTGGLQSVKRSPKRR